MWNVESTTRLLKELSQSTEPSDLDNPAELCALAMITSMIETQKLADQLELARRALDSELKAAADVQRWLLPSLPMIDGIGIAAS